MGILGIYPVSHTGWKLNPDDILVECASCGHEKYMTREFVDVAYGPPAPTCNRIVEGKRCGGQWLNVSDPPAFLGPQPILWGFERESETTDE
jgi:hypothetical protein